jgi:hypothetical protein
MNESKTSPGNRGPIPVRFKDAPRARIKAAAKKSGLSEAAIVRLGVSMVLPQIEAGAITLPLNGDQSAA